MERSSDPGKSNQLTSPQPGRVWTQAPGYSTEGALPLTFAGLRVALLVEKSSEKKRSLGFFWHS